MGLDARDALAQEDGRLLFGRFEPSLAPVHAYRRQSSRRLALGVAVLRAWPDGPGDGIRAEILLADGRRGARPGSVLVSRA